MNSNISLAVVLAILASPLAAEEADSDMREGANLMAKGAEMLLRGLVDEFEPQLRAMEGLEGLSGYFSDLSGYHPPEVLPNGDIVIRKKTPLELEAEKEGEIDL